MHFFPNIPANVLMFEDYHDWCSYLMTVFVCMAHASTQRVLLKGTIFTCDFPCPCLSVVDASCVK